MKIVENPYLSCLSTPPPNDAAVLTLPEAYWPVDISVRCFLAPGGISIPRDSPREARFKQNHGEGPISLGGVSRCYNPPPQKMGGGHLSCWCKSNQSFFLVSMTKTRHYRYDTRINDKTHFTTTLTPCHSEVSEMQQQKPCCKSSCISGVLHDQTEKSSWIQYSNWFWTHLNTLGLYGFLFSHLIDPS